MSGMLRAVMRTLKNRAFMLFLSFLMLFCVSASGRSADFGKLKISEHFWLLQEGGSASLFQMTEPLGQKTAAVKAGEPLEVLFAVQKQGTDISSSAKESNQQSRTELTAIFIFILLSSSLRAAAGFCCPEERRQKLILRRLRSGRYPPCFL